MTRLAPGHKTRHCRNYFCPHLIWPKSVVLSIGRDLIDWLLDLLFVPIDSFINYIWSIILSTEVHPKLCQQMQHSTPRAVIRLLHWQSPDLIRKGTWPSPLLSPPHLTSPHADSTLTSEQTDCHATSSGTGTTPPYPAPVTRALLLQLLFLQGSNKKVPPATQLMRVKQPGSHSAMKKEKRFSTSSFPLSANRELQKLVALAGTPPFFYIRSYQSVFFFLNAALCISLCCYNTSTQISFNSSPGKFWLTFMQDCMFGLYGWGESY